MTRYLRAGVRAFEMSMKVRTVNAFTNFSWLVFPLIFVILGLLLLSPGGGGRGAASARVRGRDAALALLGVGTFCPTLVFGLLLVLPPIAVASVAFHQAL